MKSIIGKANADEPEESTGEGKKRKTKKSFVSSIFSEYCSNTSIHGIGYLGAEDKSVVEKIWWFTVFALSVAVCVFLISNTWKKWENTPVVMSFSHTQTSIWEIPFPAVSICPVNKILQNRYNYTQKYRTRENLTGKELKKFWDISLICNLQFVNPENLNKTTDADAIASILKVAPKMYETIFEVKWQDLNGYYHFFAPQLTEEGLCFTSNALIGKNMYTDQVNPNLILEGHNKASEGWSIEGGYSDDLDMETYPERTAQDGIKSGLSLTIVSMSYDKDYVCGDSISGYKVLLHNPAEIPLVRHRYILAPLNTQVTVSVKPDMVTTSKDLKHVAPHTRNCYFAHEKSLRFYKMYTEDNCHVECLANITREMCKCLPFYSPRDNETDICGFGSITCLQIAYDFILKFHMMMKKNKGNEKDKILPSYEIFRKCRCLPSCTSIDYTAETSQTNLYLAKSIDESGEHGLPLSRMETTRVDIFFRQKQFMTLHRTEMYGLTEFLANCGGLLGLFMGFSFLSLVEILYFVTLRVWCTLKNKEEPYDANT